MLQASEAQKPCNIFVYGDRTVCLKCTQQWDTNDPSPPDCPGDLARYWPVVKQVIGYNVAAIAAALAFWGLT